MQREAEERNQGKVEGSGGEQGITGGRTGNESWMKG